MFGWSTAVLSHNAGNTAATGVSFLLLATSCAISERSREQHRNRAAPTAAPNSHGRRRGTGTWRMTSASPGGIREWVEEQQWKQIGIMHLGGVTLGV